MQLALSVHPQPQTKVEQYFRLLYGEHMRDYPRRRIQREKRIAKYTYDKHRPYVFVGQKRRMKGVATFYTLFSKIYDPDVDTTYYTPNSFYRSDRRQESSARWIHAFQLDVDVKGAYADQEGITLLDVLDRCEAAGLPYPTAVVQTPSGGFQPIWMLNQSVRATQKAIRLFEAIQRHMAEDLGADVHAIGVERIFRTPTEDTLVYFEPQHTYSFQHFVDWREINHPLEWPKHQVRVIGYDIMREPAIERLYHQDALIGEREATCLTLCLAFKFSGCSEDEAMREMRLWWEECCEKGGRDPFTLKDVEYRVRRVYRSSKLNGPSVDVVRRLTGLDFAYKSFRVYTPAKTREQRKYTHKEEWKSDLVAYLEKEGVFKGSLSELAATLGCPLSSLKVVIRELESEGVLLTETKRGRGGYTSVLLCAETKASEEKQTAQKNSQIHNTIGEVVGGGLAFAEVACSLLDGSRQPYPLFLRSFFADLGVSLARSVPPEALPEVFASLLSALRVCIARPDRSHSLARRVELAVHEVLSRYSLRF